MLEQFYYEKTDEIYNPFEQPFDWEYFGLDSMNNSSRLGGFRIRQIIIIYMAKKVSNIKPGKDFQLIKAIQGKKQKNNE